MCVKCVRGDEEVYDETGSVCGDRSGIGAAGLGAPFGFRRVRCLQTVKVTGKITKIEWMNPHGWVYLDVKNDKGDHREMAV